MITGSLQGITLAVEETTTSSSNVGFGSIVLLIAVGALMVWMAYLWLNSRRTRKLEDTPPNLQPGLSDDELETNKLNRVLLSAVVSAAVLAAVMGLYYASESNRQAAAAEKLHERDVEEGEKWFEFFSCIDCHGPGGVGGGATHIETRSGLETSWAAPSLNDELYRFTPEEITEIIVYGRDGTPMPASGLDGGGAMTKQEVQQVIAYIESVQITQGEVLDEVNGTVDAALNRLANAEETIGALIATQQAEREDILAAEDKFRAVEDFPDEIRILLQADGTCTEASANLVGGTCSEPGTDSDRDGLSDRAEFELEGYASTMLLKLTQRQAGTLEIVDDTRFELNFDRSDAFSNEDAQGHPIPDLVAADELLTALEAEHLILAVTTERVDVFLEQVDQGIAFLEESLAAKRWEVDLDAVAARANISVADAERALGLFNGYCARCHTGGYSAGIAYQQITGAGAWGPALIAGRPIVQFPDPADQVDFIIRGTEFAVNYGINGLGTGRMPGFGLILSKEDIELITKFERAL